MVRLVLILATLPLSAATVAADPDRRIFAWASGGGAEKSAAQMRNTTWKGLLDGVHAFCGVSFGAGAVEANLTQLAACDPLQKVCEETGAEFHVAIGTVPEAAIVNPKPFIDSAVKLAKLHKWRGFNIDDESNCAPRSTLANLTKYIGFVDKLSTALAALDPPAYVTADIQAIFGVQNCTLPGSCVPNACHGQGQPKSCPCGSAPMDIRPDARLGPMLSASKISRWIEMDDYYFTTARFLDALDWHAENVALGKLGVGMMNRVVGSPGGGITQNGWAARFHAIKASKVTQLDIFLLPIDDELLQWLWRWKTKEKHCPNGGVLSAFEPAANCLPPSARH